MYAVRMHDNGEVIKMTNQKAAVLAMFPCFATFSLGLAMLGAPEFGVTIAAIWAGLAIYAFLPRKEAI